MTRYQRDFISLADLYRAYRKAKADAFYDSGHFHAIAYARYEKNLHQNLKRLLSKLVDADAPWTTDLRQIGGFGFVPKSIGEPDKSNGDGLHFSTLDQLQDWQAICAKGAGKVRAQFRQVIIPTVPYQIISALWIIKVGHLYDAAIDHACSYGNKLRRLQGKINLDCSGLFVPYFSAYRNWRERGLETMRRELELGNEIYATTMDIRRFYHSVSPNFILEKEFLKAANISLTTDEVALTCDLVRSCSSWYRSTPDFATRPEGSLPVGLSASKIISNVFLIDFDRLVRQRLNPCYYGRYVDDIFLVTKPSEELKSGTEYMRWLARALKPGMVFGQSDDGCYLRYSAKFGRDAEIVFSGDKQKIFHLSGSYGLDLVDQISEQIRKQSSEHRLLPLVPRTQGEMLSDAFLATPNATLEADALRKADAVSIRRLGFSLLVRDVESYARDLRPKDWREARNSFYDMVCRHVVTPHGLFNYMTYICRVFGLMVSCNDHRAAIAFLARFEKICDLLRATIHKDGEAKRKLELSINFYVNAFAQVAMQASTVKGFRFGRRFLRTLRTLRKLSGSFVLGGVGDMSVRQLSKDLLLADLGRRSYREYWFRENKKEARIPSMPKQLSVHRVLRLGLIREFRRSVNRELNVPYWPALVFATRPLSIAEMTLVAPSLLARPEALEDAIFALRGARVTANSAPFASLERGGHGSCVCVNVPRDRKRRQIVTAVTSFETTDTQWQAAYDGKPDWSLRRYERMRKLINAILTSNKRADYVVFPELSLPRRWVFGVANRLAQNGCSLIAGLENNNASGTYRNDVLVALATRWTGYRAHVYVMQHKMEAAHHEVAQLKNPVRRLFKAQNKDDCRPVYIHGNHAFGVLICSDVTNIDNRFHFQGAIDTLFVVEWNSDLNTFSYLVDSASHDLHSFIVQANNRVFGDSRIRAPYAVEWRRDVVRVRGGEEDYFVLATLDVNGLRRFQERFSPRRYERAKGQHTFKPLPIGFSMSAWRRTRSDG